MRTDQQEEDPLFSNDPRRATKEIVCGFFLILIGLVVGGNGGNSGNGYVAIAGVLVMLAGLCCFSVADARIHGTPPALMSFRSVSYPFVWIVVKLRALYRWNLSLFGKDSRERNMEPPK